MSLKQCPASVGRGDPCSAPCHALPTGESTWKVPRGVFARGLPAEPEAWDPLTTLSELLGVLRAPQRGCVKRVSEWPPPLVGWPTLDREEVLHLLTVPRPLPPRERPPCTVTTDTASCHHRHGLSPIPSLPLSFMLFWQITTLLAFSPSR